MHVSENKELNINNAVRMLKVASENGTQVALLPEMFNCPYDSSLFYDYSETMQTSRTLSEISNCAKKLNMYIAAGSIPEKCGSKLFNTCFIFSNKGQIIGRHRKTHLFDIDIPGKITFKESDSLYAGDGITVVDTEYCKIGVAICYDIRFPEFIRMAALKGAKLLLLPASFNMTTGPAHWELLMRTRALDNQLYVAAASPARNENSSYVSYGNSMIVDPWGSIISKADKEEKIIYGDIDLDMVQRIRIELPGRIKNGG
jgi:predicted amidohydrolase